MYVGENALIDTDKSGKSRKCNVVHSGATMGRVAGSTLKNGWTHVVLFKEVDYGFDNLAGGVLGGAVNAADTVKSDPKGAEVPSIGVQKPDVSTFYKVKKDSFGGAVRRLQKWLQDLGYTLAEDGEFGPATENAVRYFQKEKHLVVDAHCWPGHLADACRCTLGCNGIIKHKGVVVGMHDIWLWIIRVCGAVGALITGLLGGCMLLSVYC